MTKRILFLSTLALSIISLTGCGILKKEQTHQFNKADEVQVAEQKEAASIIESDSLSVAGLMSTDKKLSGEWTIVSVFNKKVNLEEMPFINFEISTNKIYGNGGCNVINGDFTVESGQKLKFENVVTTLRACNNMKIESLILNAINETNSYFYSEHNGMVHLNFCNAKGAAIMTLKRHNLNVLNGAWTVTEIEGEKINNDRIRLVIDIQENKLHGNSGCNIINGLISLDPKKNNSIQFSQIVSTRRACPDMSTETALLVGLEKVEFYKKKGSHEIEFFDNKNDKIIILKRLPLMK